MSNVCIRGMKRYLQGPGACSQAAISSVGNYHDKRIDYDFICSLHSPDGSGMYGADIASVLNRIGFTSVTIITADLDYFDCKWRNFSRSKLSKTLDDAAKKHSADLRPYLEGYHNWLKDKDNDNNLIIDPDFSKYICDSLEKGVPVMCSFNWNLLFGLPKWDEYGKDDPVNGDWEAHEVVLYGFDDRSVKVLDSHYEFYKGRLAKFAKGRYEVKWETLMIVMGGGAGELIIPHFFEKDRLDELVSKHDNNS